MFCLLYHQCLEMLCIRQGPHCRGGSVKRRQGPGRMDSLGGTDLEGPDQGRHEWPSPRPRTQGHHGTLAAHIYLHPSPRTPSRPQEAQALPTQHQPRTICPERERKVAASSGPHLAVTGTGAHSIPWLPGEAWSDPHACLGAPGKAQGSGKFQKNPGTKTKPRLGLPSGLHLGPRFLSVRPGQARASTRIEARRSTENKKHPPKKPAELRGLKKIGPLATGNRRQTASKLSSPTWWPDTLQPMQAHMCTRTHTHTLHPLAQEAKAMSLNSAFQPRSQTNDLASLSVNSHIYKNIFENPGVLPILMMVFINTGDHLSP